MKEKGRMEYEGRKEGRIGKEGLGRKDCEERKEGLRRKYYEGRIMKEGL